jgi:hypothetical protein
MRRTNRGKYSRNRTHVGILPSGVKYFTYEKETAQEKMSHAGEG